MGDKPEERFTPEEFDAMLDDISRHMDDEPALGGRSGLAGPSGPSRPADGGFRVTGVPGPGAAGSGSPARPGGVAGHWLRVAAALVGALVVTAVVGIYVAFPVALIAGIVLTGLVISLATQSGYRRGLGFDKPADAALGLGAMVAVLSAAYFAPVFYLSGAGKEGVTSDVLVTHGSRGSVSCQAVLPNGKTAKVPCLKPGDRDRLSAGHYRVVYDPDGHTAAWTGTKSDLPVALGSGLIGGGLVLAAAGAGLGISRAARGRTGWHPAVAAD